MDFKDVRQITVPQGDVLKIVDSSNNTIWRKRMFPVVKVTPSTGGSVTISPLTGDTIRYGQDFHLHATPESGYKFTKYVIPEYGADIDGKPIYIDSAEATSVDVDFSNTVTDVTISAFFESDIPPLAMGFMNFYESYEEARPHMANPLV